MYNYEEIKTIFRLLDDETKKNIDLFVGENSQNDYKEFGNADELLLAFGENNGAFHEKLGNEDLEHLQSYTGYSFKFINAVARNNWNYEDHGPQDEATVQAYKDSVNKLETAIFKYPALPFDFTTFRGVNLNVFSRYGVSSLRDLAGLKDHFLYESGFTSTSLLQSSSFFNRKLDNGINYNVLIRYHIPKECSVGAFLSSSLTSVATAQKEFLMNVSTLGKVMNIEIDEESQTAILDINIVPTIVWDPQRVLQFEEKQK